MSEENRWGILASFQNKEDENEVEPGGFSGEASDAHRMWGDRGWQGVTVQPGPMALERAQRPEYRMQGKEGEAGWGWKLCDLHCHSFIVSEWNIILAGGEGLGERSLIP